MAAEEAYHSDVQAILAHRYDGGADYFTTPDKRLLKGTPFSAYNSGNMLLELGLQPSHPVLSGIAGLFFEALRPDGRFKVYPKGGILPCHTAAGAHLLCNMGFASDARLAATFYYFLETCYTRGGWRCNKFSYGRGPETDYANPWPTLMALDAFRHTAFLNKEPLLDAAVEFLLFHWQYKKPIGPCHYGIGSLFMQVEYPLGSYNLFHYVYVLSFYNRAKNDARFKEALAALQSRMQEGQVVVQRVSPKLAGLAFCKKGQKSVLATRRYQEIQHNMGQKP